MQTAIPDPAPGNVSTLDIHSLLPAGTKVVVHSTDWFTKTSNVNHVFTYYDSNDAATVAAQDADMIQRHLDGRMIDWYSQFNTVTDGTTQKISSDMAGRCSSPQNCPLEYAIIEDQGAVTRTQGSRAACSTSDATCMQASILQDLCYANANYFGTAAYLKMNSSTFAWATSTNPVVGFFPPSTTSAWNTAVGNLKTLTASNGWAATNCPAGQQQANGGLIFFDSDTTNVAETPYGGGSSWVGVSAWSATNQFLIDGASGNYHETLYSSCASNPSKLCIGSAVKGFDDNIGNFGSNRVMAQECGETLMATLALSSNFTGSNLTFQLPTWNDYDEGTELETGVDSCYSVSASIASNTLSWSVTSTDSTYAPTSSGAPTGTQNDHWRIWACTTADTQCTVFKDGIALSTLSQDVSGIPVGAYHLYVQLVGKPMIWNKLSGSVAYTH